MDKINLSCYTPTEAAPIIDNHVMADNYLIELPRAQALISFDHRSVKLANSQVLHTEL